MHSNVLKNLVSALLLTGIAACNSTSSTTQGAVEQENPSASASTKPVNLQPATLFAKLPNTCTTPDAFDIAPDGSLTLSCVNYAGGKNKPTGRLLRITEDGQVTELAQLTGPNGKGSARPMGIAYAPDGSLYVADNQGRNQGRLLRLTFNQGKLANTEVVAYGMSSPNGVRYFNGAIYLTQLRLPKFKTKNMTSGVYRFAETDRNVKVASDGSSDKLIFSTQTENPERQFGIDGLVFDKQGRLYVGDFGDAEIYRLTLNTQGVVVNQEMFATLPKTVGIDGINIDEQGNLYLAGFLQNEIYKVDTQGKATLLAQYPDNNGANGEIDQPADLIVYKNKLIISNFDLMKGKGIVNSGHGKPYTVSAIAL
ncbi:hypothetical protein C2869_05285 [Saccharobesus litoralis]|uniref:SMP-30/Gluconolactonase/LRE-like region domain-containing protein n=1 Tax=Saccharobesus litoralis TaxID=2172099 RepID=A0A2S0VNW0_9ALTE|nr:SMP-30/gluconolactonase/LRE family protein [Saccharobesus litoralis]AWB65889.1 hypothetical protein C2869_05285 [Saccharobesus litoralis]